MVLDIPLSSSSSANNNPGSLLNFDPSILSFTDDGKINGVDTQRAKERAELEAQEKRLEELRRKIQMDEQRLRAMRNMQEKEAMQARVSFCYVVTVNGC
jgi:hypothetical protein